MWGKLLHLQNCFDVGQLLMVFSTINTVSYTTVMYLLYVHQKSVVELLLVDPSYLSPVWRPIYISKIPRKNTSLSNVQGDAEPLQECWLIGILIE